MWSFVFAKHINVKKLKITIKDKDNKGMRRNPLPCSISIFYGPPQPWHRGSPPGGSRVGSCSNAYSCARPQSLAGAESFLMDPPLPTRQRSDERRKRRLEGRKRTINVMKIEK